MNALAEIRSCRLKFFAMALAIHLLATSSYGDERLSANGKIACVSCHAASRWGADAERFSLDAKEKRTKRSSQSVFKSMLQPHLRWTGDRTSGAHQAGESLTDLMEFANADDRDSQQIQSSVAFLTSLTGEGPANHANPNSASETNMNQPSAEFQLVQYGSMHETIGMQQHQGRVTLGELMARPNFYAVGALEKLQGEITVINSKVIVSSVTSAGALVSRSDEAGKLQATLLVGGEVPNWRSVTIPKELSGEAMESFILLNAERLGVLTDRPFPFLIEGAFSKVRLHVINGACPVHARARNKPIPQGQQPFEHEFATLDGQLLGIFARNAAGKLTHPGTSMHAHMVYSDETAQQITGHIESFTVDVSSTLRLPAK